MDSVPQRLQGQRRQERVVLAGGGLHKALLQKMEARPRDEGRILSVPQETLEGRQVPEVHRKLLALEELSAQWPLLELEGLRSEVLERLAVERRWQEQ